MDKNWDVLVAEGKEIAGRKDKDQWHLGELASKVERDYGKNLLGRYASDIGENPATLAGARTTALAWPDKKMRPPNFSLAKDLNRHPDRADIVHKNPSITREEARAIMKKWRAAQPTKSGSKKKQPAIPPDVPLNNRRQQEAEVERQLADRVEDWMQKIKPHLDDARAVKAGRRGLVTKDESDTIKRCLHPDNSASIEVRTKAFIVWRRIEHLLMSEEDAPTVIVFPLRRKNA
jgi:hypothetical protein